MRARWEEPALVMAEQSGTTHEQRAELESAGNALRKAGSFAEAIQHYQQAATASELPCADLCVKIARCHVQLNQPAEALSWLTRVVDVADTYTTWQSAAALLEKVLQTHTPQVKRAVRVAVLGSYTTTQWVPMLRLAALCQGVLIEAYESDFDQYQQDVLDERSGLYTFKPEVIVFAVHDGAAALPEYADDASKAVELEAGRWANLWKTAAQRSGARVIMHNFAVRSDSAMGHLSTRVAGSRYSMMQQLNRAIGEAAGSNVSIVDCDRISATFGKTKWFDDRYWYLSKQAVALDALPMLATHTAAVLAADLGLSRKCLVLDLDNTLWGGVIGEDGLTGIELGNGPRGEAFVALQKYILQLKNKGVILAVCSKNNDADAREPFEKHSDMQMSLDDVSIFVANWQPKHENIRRIAQTLNIGLDSLVFLDDNPAEREIVRQHLPEVDVIALPVDPTGYPQALASYLMFETSSYTAEDSQRAAQYKAKAEIAELQQQTGSLEDFHRSLQMTAVVAPFDELHLPRIVQLIGKTNQFNLTTRRHNIEQVRRFMDDSAYVHLYLKLTDRFADHGLVSLLIARRVGIVLDIESWLMSCRVIGRTVEAELLSQMCRTAEQMGCTRLRGTYIPTAKNVMVQEIFSRFGFEQVSRSEGGETVWEYDLAAHGPIENGFIEVRSTPDVVKQEVSS